MKPFGVDYYLEQYIPEYKTYMQLQIFTEDEVRKVAALRERFERGIQETFQTTLKTYADYLEHLAATRKLALDRYRQAQLDESQMPAHFNIPTQQFQRLFKQCLNWHRDNLKAWLYLINFAWEQRAESLLAQTTQNFVRSHSHFWLAWLLRAKCVETQASIADARRVYNKSAAFIKPFTVQHRVRHLTEALNPDEEIKQSLPGDALVLFINWAISEADFAAKITEGIDVDQIEDKSLKALATGALVEHAIFKALCFIFQFDFKGNPITEEQRYNGVCSNAHVTRFHKEICALCERPTINAEALFNRACLTALEHVKIDANPGYFYFTKTTAQALQLRASEEQRHDSAGIDVMLAEGDLLGED